MTTYRLKKEYEGMRDIVIGGVPVEPPVTDPDPALERQLQEHPAFTDKPAPGKASADKKEN